jgi:hypothetical protein
MPRQGWMYLGLNHICFYSFFMGKESKIIIPYTDIMVRLFKLDFYQNYVFNVFVLQNLEKVNNLLASGIKVKTRNGDYFFYMFLNFDETYQLIEQLTNFAVQKYVERLIFACRFNMITLAF